jgi:hypothetical protein
MYEGINHVFQPLIFVLFTFNACNVSIPDHSGRKELSIVFLIDSIKGLKSGESNYNPTPLKVYPLYFPLCISCDIFYIQEFVFYSFETSFSIKSLTLSIRYFLVTL